MELRNAEAEMNDLRASYESLRRARIVPAVPIASTTVAADASSPDAAAAASAAETTPSLAFPSLSLLPPLADLIERVLADRPPPSPVAAVAAGEEAICSEGGVIVAAAAGDGRGGENAVVQNGDAPAPAPAAVAPAQAQPAGPMDLDGPNDSNGGRSSEGGASAGGGGEEAAAAAAMTAREALSAIESLKGRLGAMEEKADKFRKRLAEKDPITNAPRYGPKSAARVTSLLEIYDALVLGIAAAFGESDGTTTEGTRNGQDVTNKEVTVVVDVLRRAVADEEERTKQAEAEARDAMLNSAERRAQNEERSEAERKEREAAEIERRRVEEAELHRQAIEAKRSREEEADRAAREAREADRAFVASIPKGPDGVRAQLAVLREGCCCGAASSSESGGGGGGAAAHAAALGALHTLFDQIVSHPEEIKFRRIRRDHPKFREDIGRHAGGKEVLVAAGFRLETVDGVPCFFSKEPDLESDMDGWSGWFDGLKGTLEIIEGEMMK